MDDSALVSPAVEQQAQVQFADTTLYRYVAEGMSARFSNDELQRLADWVLSDWMRAIEKAADAHAETQSLTAYLDGLDKRPPSRLRVDLVVRYVEANAAGTFFLEVEDAYRDAARAVAASLANRRLDGAGPSKAEREEQVQWNRQGAVLSFLHRFDPVTDAQLSKLVEAYESEVGRRYVRAYTDALTDAIRSAGDALAASL